MRRLLAVALLLAACTEKTPPAEPAQRTRPLAQDGSTARALTSTPDRARIQLDLATARSAVTTYKAEHGGFPPSLAELKLEGLSYPADLAYDPATGTVRSETYPSY